MKASFFTTTMCVGALATSAYAAEFAIKGNISETLDASNNYFLTPSPPGPSGVTAKTLTAGNLSFLALTPTTRYLLDTNYSYYKYFGPGAKDTTLTWGDPASAIFSVDHITELDRYRVAASWSRTDAAVTQLAQSGFATAHGSINTFNTNGSVSHEFGRNDVATLTASATQTNFTDPTQTPYLDVSSTLFWIHTLSQTTTLNNSVNFDWFAQDNASNSQRLMWRFNSGLVSQLTQLLTLQANFGWIFANAYQSGGPPSAVTPVTVPVVPVPGQTPFFVPGVTPFQPLVGAGNGWIFDGSLTYRLLKDMTVSLSGAHAVVPVFTGQLQGSNSMSLSLSHPINQSSGLSAFASYVETNSASSLTGQVSTATKTTSDFFSAGINYYCQIAREWRTGVSYTYRDSIGIAQSHSILFSLSRDFTLLGNPTVISQAEAERARQRARNAIGQVFPGFF